MPRPSRAKVDSAPARLDAAPPVAAAAAGPQGFVAAASRVARTKIRRSTHAAEKWQEELWDLYDEVGEYRYAQNWLAQSCSRALLDVEVQDVDGTWASAEPGDLGRVYLDEMMDSCGGAPEYLRTTALHLGVPGESWTVGEEQVNPVGDITGYRWSVVTGEEFQRTGDKLELLDPDTDERRELTDDALLIRVWRPHPRRRQNADSPSKAVRGPLREIVNVSAHIGATVDSRLAGNGVLILPQEVSITTFDGVTTSGNAVDETGRDAFMQVLAQVMTGAITDRDSAAAVTPIILRMAGEFIGQVRHITFGTEFDAQSMPIRGDAIKRTALGLDMPPEQLLGTGDANHWGAWQIEESAVKVCVEPVLTLICQALSLQAIRPLLEAANAAGLPGADTRPRRVVYDAGPLILRPNKGADADLAYDRLTISTDAYRTAKGFDGDDAPGDAELQRIVWLQLLRQGKIDPVTGQPIGATAGAPGVLTPTPTPGLPGGTPDTAGDPAPVDASPPAAAAVSDRALVGVCRALTLRALERAGQRLRTRSDHAALLTVPVHDTHLTRPPSNPAAAAALLDGAFALADTLLTDYATVVDGPRLVTELEANAALMLTTGRGFAGWSAADWLAGLPAGTWRQAP